MTSKFLKIILFSIIIFMFTGCQKTESFTYTDITENEAISLINDKKPLILDVRTREEYAEQHFKNATLIPIEEIENRYLEIADYKKKDILVYCRTGRRSSTVASFLASNGFEKIYNLKGGITALSNRSLIED